MPTPIDRDRLITLLTDYEQGRNIAEPNPFGELEPELLQIADSVILPFLEGGCVPDTAVHSDEPPAYALAGFLQGLAVGYAYAKS